MGNMFSSAAKVFDFIILVIDNVVDFILGAITLVWGIAKTAVEILPLLLDIIDYLLSFIEYIIDLFTKYWRVPAVLLTLVPMYVMLFFVINRVNSILD